MTNQEFDIETPALPVVNGEDQYFIFDYDLCITGCIASRFYVDNNARVNYLGVDDYVSYALIMAESFGTRMTVSPEEEAEVLKMQTATNHVKDCILQARVDIDQKMMTTRASKIKDTFWHYYQQVATCLGVEISVVSCEHKINSLMQDTYNHYISVSFVKDDDKWLYKASIEDDEKVSLEGFTNGYAQPEYDIDTANGSVYFLLGNIAKSIAMNKVDRHVARVKRENAEAIRAKAVSKILKNTDGLIKNKKAV